MIRTQVYLPEDLYFRINLLAKKEEVPSAKLIRRLLATGLKKEGRQGPSARDTLLALSKLGGKGPKDLAENHDDYLYGDKK